MTINITQNRLNTMMVSIASNNNNNTDQMIKKATKEGIMVKIHALFSTKFTNKLKNKHEQIAIIVDKLYSINSCLADISQDKLDNNNMKSKIIKELHIVNSLVITKNSNLKFSLSVNKIGKESDQVKVSCASDVIEVIYEVKSNPLLINILESAKVIQTNEINYFDNANENSLLHYNDYKETQDIDHNNPENTAIQDLEQSKKDFNRMKLDDTQHERNDQKIEDQIKDAFNLMQQKYNCSDKQTATMMTIHNQNSIMKRGVLLLPNEGLDEDDIQHNMTNNQSIQNSIQKDEKSNLIVSYQVSLRLKDCKNSVIKGRDVYVGDVSFSTIYKINTEGVIISIEPQLNININDELSLIDSEDRATTNFTKDLIQARFEYQKLKLAEKFQKYSENQYTSQNYWNIKSNYNVDEILKEADQSSSGVIII